MPPTRAIVREPGEGYRSCISSHPLRHTIDLALARAQHAMYCRTLSELGLEVIRLARDDGHPDCCFVEDNAVIHGERALICRMAEESRRGEEDEVERILSSYRKVKRALSPATIEGGDILHLPDRLIGGLTQRTNRAGLSQMQAWLGGAVEAIADPEIVHLKSYVNYLGRGKIITTLTYAESPPLAKFDLLVIPDEEWYAANCLAIGETVLMPEGYPKTQTMVREAGFHVIPLEMSEFGKCEGALTCLSLLF